jgi:F0F1-type ATP synthase membrane subunit c/vacuolar-type H+-ATPase subunit K
MMESFVLIAIMFVTIIGPAVVIAAIGFASIRALGRNPSASPKILPAMIISLVFAEAVSIIGLLVFFHVAGSQ